MPNPSRRGQESDLLKKHPRKILLAHASPAEYDVISAEHDFHEMRLAAIAAGRSVSQATSQGPSRTVSRTTVASQSTVYERRNVERRQEAHAHALGNIAHRQSRYPVAPPAPHPDAVMHRGALALELDRDNAAMASRIYRAAELVPSSARCAEDERRRREIVKRLRNVPDAPATARRPHPDELPEIHRRREDDFVADTNNAKLPSTVVALPPIVDRHGKTHATPRIGKQHRTTSAPESAGQPTPPPEKSETARARPVHVPTKAPRLPTKPRAGRPTQTHVSLADAMRRNPKVKWDPEQAAADVQDDRGARSRYRNSSDLDKDETKARKGITNTEASEFDAFVTQFPAEENDAQKRAQEREEREALDRADREDLEADEDDAREVIEKSETKQRDTLAHDEAKACKDAEEATKRKAERARQKVRRMFDAVESDESKTRNEIESEEEQGRATVRKQLRRVLLEHESSNALQRRLKVLAAVCRDTLDTNATMSTSEAFELILQPTGYDPMGGEKRPSWAGQDRLYASSVDGLRFTRMTRRRDEDAPPVPAQQPDGDAHHGSAPEADDATKDAADDDHSDADSVGSAALVPQPTITTFQPTTQRPLPGCSSHRFMFVHLGEGYVALARATAPDADNANSELDVVAGDGGANALVIQHVTLSDAPSSVHGAHAFEVVVDDDALSPANEDTFAPFRLAQRDESEKAVGAKQLKDGGTGLVVGGTSPLIAMTVAQADADDERDFDEAVAAERARAEEKGKAEAQERLAKSTAAVGYPTGIDGKTKYELVLALNETVRINRASADDRAKLRGADARTQSALDQFVPTAREDGFIELRAVEPSADGADMAVTAPTSKTGALRMEALEGKEDQAAFELVPLEPLQADDADAEPLARFHLRPMLYPELVAQVQIDSEQRKLTLVQESNASEETCDFSFVSLEDAEVWQQAFEEEVRQREEAVKAKKLKKRQAHEQRITERKDQAKFALGTPDAFEKLEAFEMFLAADDTVRIVRTSDEPGAKLQCADRHRSVLDQFTPILDEHGYMILTVDGGDGNVAVLAPPAGKVRNALRAEAIADAEDGHDRARFEVMFISNSESPLGSGSAGDFPDRFVLRPKMFPDTVVEAALDSSAKKLHLVPEEDASNFGEFTFASLAQAESWQSERDALVHEEEALARAEEQAAMRQQALEALVGDPEAMNIFELFPAAREQARFLTPQGGDIGGPLAVQEGGGLSENQQFVFADVGEGYVNLIPWCSPESVIEYQAGKEPCFVVVAGSGVGSQSNSPKHGSRAPGGSSSKCQQFELVRQGDEGKFSIVPQTEPKSVVSILDDGTSVGLVAVEKSDPSTCEFRISQRSSSAAAADVRSETSGDEAFSGEAARRRTLEAIVGDLDAMTVWEVYPGDSPRLRIQRYRPEKDQREEKGVSSGQESGLIMRSRKAHDDEQFLFADAGEGFVRVVPYSDVNLALTVADGEARHLVLAEKSDDNLAQMFEVMRCTMSPSHGDSQMRFMLGARILPGMFVDVTDDDRAPLALMPDNALTPLSELMLITKEDADEEAARRLQSRRRSRVEAATRARRAAAAEVGIDLTSDDVGQFGIVHNDSDELVLHACPAKEGDGWRPVVADTGEAAAVARISEFAEGFVKLTVAVPGADEPQLLQLNDARDAIVVGPAKRDGEGSALSDLCAFEIVPLEDGNFCLGCKEHGDAYVIEADLNGDGSLALKAANEATSFGELKAIRMP